jgi:hypothetical protein
MSVIGIFASEYPNGNGELAKDAGLKRKAVYRFRNNLRWDDSWKEDIRSRMSRKKEGVSVTISIPSNDIKRSNFRLPSATIEEEDEEASIIEEEEEDAFIVEEEEEEAFIVEEEA